jgi:hypothetical protein
MMQQRSKAAYIHIENHEYKINPHRQQLSYNNPKFFRRPKTMLPVLLGKKAKTSLEEGKFRDYKQRMLDPIPPI